MVDGNIGTTVILQYYFNRRGRLSVKISRTAAVLTCVTLVAFISFVTLFAFFTDVSFVSFFTVNSCGFHSRIGRSNPPVAVFTDERGVAVFAVSAVLSVCSVLTISTVFAVNTVLTVYTVLTVCAVKTLQN